MPDVERAGQAQATIILKAGEHYDDAADWSWFERHGFVHNGSWWGVLGAPIRVEDVPDGKRIIMTLTQGVVVLESDEWWVGGAVCERDGEDNITRWEVREVGRR